MYHKLGLSAADLCRILSVNAGILTAAELAIRKSLERKYSISELHAIKERACLDESTPDAPQVVNFQVTFPRTC